jgi:hypothetical protein
MLVGGDFAMNAVSIADIEHALALSQARTRLGVPCNG